MGLIELPASSQYIRLLLLHFQGKGKGKGGASQYGYGKGKGGASQYGYDSGYGKGKGKGGGNPYSYYGYVGDDATSAPPAPSPTAPDGNPACIEVTFQETFLFFSADLAIPPTSSDPNEVGTTFIYEPSPLFNGTEFVLNGASVELEDSQVTGVCTRTSSTLDGDIGGGVCQFTIYADGSYITLGGFVEDYVLGVPPPTLVITGGSGFNTGLTGEVALLPLDVNGDAFTGDFYFDAFGYQAFVSGIMIVCEVIDGI
jgi:hypothetical protein